MEILIAIAHILGSIVALLIFGIVIALIGSWESERINKQVAEETSMVLGVKVEDLDDESLAPSLLKLSAEKYSSELFKNRLADFCGIVRNIWAWIGNIVLVLVMLAVIWYTITDSTENAVYSWLVLAIAVIFLLCSVIFSFVCLLLTGRYPGEAKAARKIAAEWARRNSKLVNSYDN